MNLNLVGDTDRFSELADPDCEICKGAGVYYVWETKDLGATGSFREVNCFCVLRKGNANLSEIAKLLGLTENPVGGYKVSACNISYSTASDSVFYFQYTVYFPIMNISIHSIPFSSPLSLLSLALDVIESMAESDTAASGEKLIEFLKAHKQGK